MICDALQEDEIYEAFLLYASLHGLCTEEAEVRQRVQNYCNNQPDWLIDDAILAFVEDRMVAPPDIVLPRWGKSRVYELVPAPSGGWLHQVSEGWFDNGCRFSNGPQDPLLAHFWTEIMVGRTVGSCAESAARPLMVGTRLQFRQAGDAVAVQHRQGVLLGWLPTGVATEICERQHLEPKYLTLLDALAAEGDWLRCKLLVVVACSHASTSEVITYADNAFHATRNKC